MNTIEFGIPWRSMRIAYWGNFQQNVGGMREVLEVPVKSSVNDGLLPAGIIPLGFALNTLLAVGVLLGATEGIAFARRRVRRAKGRCAACGYDRGGLANDAACPECGRKAS